MSGKLDIQEAKVLDGLFKKYVTYPKAGYIAFGMGQVKWLDEATGKFYRIKVEEVKKK